MTFRKYSIWSKNCTFSQTITHMHYYLMLLPSKPRVWVQYQYHIGRGTEHIGLTIRNSTFLLTKQNLISDFLVSFLYIYKIIIMWNSEYESSVQCKSQEDHHSVMLSYQTSLQSPCSIAMCFFVAFGQGIGDSLHASFYPHSMGLGTQMLDSFVCSLWLYQAGKLETLQVSL